MRKFLFVRNLSPDGDAGAGAAATTDTGAGAGAADAGAGAGAADTGAADAAPVNNPPTAAEARQAEANDLLGGLPNVPRGTSTPAPKVDAASPAAQGADTGAAATGTTPDAAATAAAAATPAPFDVAKFTANKYKNEAELSAALSELDTTKATLADANVQAFVALASDPEKFAAFTREQGRDYAAEAVSNPREILFAAFKEAHPEYGEKTVGMRFKAEYDKAYPDLDINDPEDEDYQNSAALRDEDAQIAAKKFSAVQATKREEMLAAAAKLTPQQAAAVESGAGAFALTEAEVATHLAAVDAVDAALTEYSLTVDGEKIPVPITGREDAKLFTQDMFGYFEKSGMIAKDGTIDVAKFHDFALRAINHEANMQAVYQAGIKKGAGQGAAVLINPGDNAAAAASAAAAAAAAAAASGQLGAPANVRPSYFERQKTAAEVDY